MTRSLTARLRLKGALLRRALLERAERLPAPTLLLSYTALVGATYVATDRLAEGAGERAAAALALYLLYPLSVYPFCIFVVGEKRDFLLFVEDLLHSAATLAAMLALRLTLLSDYGHLTYYELTTSALFAAFGLKPLLRWSGGWARAAWVAYHESQQARMLMELAVLAAHTDSVTTKDQSHMLKGVPGVGASRRPRPDRLTCNLEATISERHGREAESTDAPAGQE